MMYFNNLLLIMSACGSAAFAVYLAAKRLYLHRLSPTYRYRLLQLVLAFYLLPFPLLANYLRDFLCILFRKPDLFIPYHPPGEPIPINLCKIIYIKDRKLSVPALDIALIGVVLLAIVVATVYLIYYSYRCHQEKQLALLCAEGRTAEAEALLPNSYQTLRHQRHVRICAGPEGSPVFTCGTRHPTVVLEGNKRSCNQKFLLMHELTHVRYYDTLFRTLSFLAVALHFYNPLIYLFFREVKGCMELHCDEIVVPDLDSEERIVYGHLLISNAMRSQPRLAVPFASNNYSSIKERIALIKSPVPKRVWMAFLTAVVLVPVALLPALAYEVPQVIINGVEMDDPDGVDWAYYVDETPINEYPEDEKYFSETVSEYYIDEDGTVTFVTEASTTAACAQHTYKNSVYYRHRKNNSGGCTVKKYSCKRCSKCDNIIDKKCISTVTYDPCPHKK